MMKGESEEIDSWIDLALREYADGPIPNGFETRMIASLREHARRSRRILTLAVGFATVVALLTGSILSHVLGEPTIPIGPVRAGLPAPRPGKVVIAEPRKHVEAASPKRRDEITRGVPMLVTPLSSQERAILTMVRKSHARELAGLAIQQDEDAKALEKSRQEFDGERREQ